MNLQLDMERMSPVKLLLVAAMSLMLVTGCGRVATGRVATGRVATGRVATPLATEQRYESAKALFERAGRDYHIPSAQARGEQRRTLEEQAAKLYADAVRNYDDQPWWASQALRSLANIRASQTNVTEAVKLYAQVAERFPKQDFEVLMSWKSAADLLSDCGRHDDANVFYQRIITRFDQSDALPIVKSVVRGSKARLQDSLLLTRHGD
jgi:tetratricopeptide (TPR) repeat protein